MSEKRIRHPWNGYPLEQATPEEWPVDDPGVEAPEPAPEPTPKAPKKRPAKKS